MKIRVDGCEVLQARLFYEEKAKVFKHLCHYFADLFLFRCAQFDITCSVTRPLNGSEGEGDLVLIQTSLLLLCKSSCSSANKVHLHDKCR